MNTGKNFPEEGNKIPECRGIDTLSSFGKPSIIEHFRENYIHGAEYSLEYGIERIQPIIYQDNSCYPGTDYHSID